MIMLFSGRVVTINNQRTIVSLKGTCCIVYLFVCMKVILHDVYHMHTSLGRLHRQFSSTMRRGMRIKHSLEITINLFSMTSHHLYSRLSQGYSKHIFLQLTNNILEEQIRQDQVSLLYLFSSLYWGAGRELFLIYFCCRTGRTSRYNT